MTEQLLKKDFIEWMKSQGVDVIAEEIAPFGNGGFINDVIYLDKEKRFICVELKLIDWKKVVEQAVRIRRHHPLVYIAMPLPATIQKRDKIESIVKANGLGLFWYNKEGSWHMQFSPQEYKSALDENHFRYFNFSIEQSLFLHYHFTFIAPFLGQAALKSRTVEYKTKKIIW